MLNLIISSTIQSQCIKNVLNILCAAKFFDLFGMFQIIMLLQSLPCSRYFIRTEHARETFVRVRHQVDQSDIPFLKHGRAVGTSDVQFLILGILRPLVARSKMHFNLFQEVKD